MPLRKVFPAGGRLAADALLSNAGRTAATAAALTIGLSVVVVNSTFSASFMGTVSDQLEASFARDFTVQAAGQTLETGGGPGVPHRLARADRRDARDAGRDAHPRGVPRPARHRERAEAGHRHGVRPRRVRR